MKILTQFIWLVAVLLGYSHAHAESPSAKLRPFQNIELKFNVLRKGERLKSVDVRLFLSCSNTTHEGAGEFGTDTNRAELSFRSQSVVSSSGQIIVRLSLLEGASVMAPAKEKFFDKQRCHAYAMVFVDVLNDKNEVQHAYFTGSPGLVVSKERREVDMTDRLISNLSGEFFIDYVFAGTYGGKQPFYNFELTQKKNNTVLNHNMLIGYSSEVACSEILN